MSFKNDLEDRNKSAEAKKDTNLRSSPCLLTSLTCLIFGCCLLICGAVAGALYFVLEEDTNDNSLRDDLVIDFEETEFNFFEFIAICDEVSRRNIFVEEDESNEIGLSTCFGGHRYTCDIVFGSEGSSFGLHCPTIIGGECFCDQGALHIFEINRLECKIDLQDEEDEDTLNSYYTTDECVLVTDEFEADEVLAASNIDTISGNEVQAGLDIFNDFVKDCSEEHDVLVLDEVPGPSIFQGCINENVHFECGPIGYEVTIRTCNTATGVKLPINNEDLIFHQASNQEEQAPNNEDK